MLANNLFYLVFFSQLIVVSWLYPGSMVKRLSFVLEKYPPEHYPKMYPIPVKYIERTMALYQFMNRVIFGAGILIILSLIWFTTSSDWQGGIFLPWSSSGEWDAAIVVPFFLLQMAPQMYMEGAAFKYYKHMRNIKADTQRSAELKPRRLFNYISPLFIFSWGVLYVVFVVLALNFHQNELAWGGEGFIKIFGVSCANVFFICALYWIIYGKKLDPHQSSHDRHQQIKLIVKQLVLVMNVTLLFASTRLTLDQFPLQDYEAVYVSFFMQILVVILWYSLKGYKLEQMDYEVYRANT